MFLDLSWNIPLWQQCCVCREGYQASSEFCARSESFYDVTKSVSLFPEVLAPAVRSAVRVIHKGRSRLLAACSIFVTRPPCHPKPFLPCQFSRKSTFYGLGLSREHLLRARHLSLPPSCPSASSSEESHGPLSKWEVLTAAAL